MARRDSRNRAVFWKPPGIAGLSLMRAEFTTQEFAPHWHEALVVGVTEQGGAEVSSRGEVQHAEPSALFVFNPTETHAGWMGGSRNWHYRSIYISQSAIDAAADALGIAELPGFTRNRITDDELVRSFLALHRALEAPGEPLLQQELLVSSLGMLIRRHGSSRTVPQPPSRDGAIAKRIMRWIEERSEESLTLNDIAAAFDMTQYQLIALFKQSIGLTPHAFLIQARLRTACRLLAAKVSPAAAAVSAGFYDQSALGRHFKRRFGFTPRQYADALTA